MARVRCVTCGGVFDQMLADGTRYFHVCTPLSSAELRAAIAANRVRLPPGETVEDALTRRQYQRTRRRDENIVRPVDDATSPSIRLPGRGVVPAAPSSDTDEVVVPD